MKADIYYMNREGWAKFGSITKGRPVVEDLPTTHVLLNSMTFLESTSDREGVAGILEIIFTSMQGENWSPNGEARPIIKELGLQHTSMSVGDVVVLDNEVAYAVAGEGFKKMKLTRS